VNGKTKNQETITQQLQKIVIADETLSYISRVNVVIAQQKS